MYSSPSANAAFAFADWDSLGTDVEVVVFHEHLHQQDALVERLDGFEVIAAMRERTPFDRELLQRLPKLRLLITTAMANASFLPQDIPFTIVIRVMKNTITEVRR